MIIWFLFGFMFAFLVIFAVAYFKFISLHKAVKRRWMRLDISLKNRKDLLSSIALLAAALPNLDKNIATALNKAKDQLPFCNTIVKRAETEIEISKYLAQIFAAAKAQPAFAQHIQFLHLCQAVSSYENRIESYKRKYNSAVRDFNTLAEVIPLNILVKILEFEKFEYFDFEKSV